VNIQQSASVGRRSVCLGLERHGTLDYYHSDDPVYTRANTAFARPYYYIHTSK